MAKIIIASLSDLLGALSGNHEETEPTPEEIAAEEADRAARKADFDARSVGQLERDDGLMISTVRVPDKYANGRTFYQTGVAHPDYTDEIAALLGLPTFIVVQEYNTAEAALEGHNAWVAKFSAPSSEWPSELHDVSTMEASAEANGRTYARQVTNADDDLAA